MNTNASLDNAYEIGYGVFAKRLAFEEEKADKEAFFRPSAQDGEGIMYQIHPAPGLFVSAGEWRFYHAAERPYWVEQMFLEVYLLESGGVTLIQNGKKAFPVPTGVNMYINKLSQGRVCYAANTPIRYVSVLLFTDFLQNRFQECFKEEDFDISEMLHFKTYNYNTPEVQLLFLQLKQKMKDQFKSRMYYESKVGELLSIVINNYRNEKERVEIVRKRLTAADLKRMELVKATIDNNILEPPVLTQLCRIATVSESKLRTSFKIVYGKPIGEYIRDAKMKHALLLLSDYQRTIYSIASYLGYASPGKFSIAFKKAYGVSPENYRRSIRT